MAGHHCEDEHHDHTHSHEPSIETYSQQSLYAHIDSTKLQILNGRSNNSGTSLTASFLKSQTDKYDTSRYLESDADCQLLIQIPFTSSVKIFTIIFRVNKNGSGYSTPRHIEVYKNFNKNLDFDTVNSLKPDFIIEYPNNIGVEPSYSEAILNDDDTFYKFDLPRNIFQNCESLTLFFKDNWSADEDDLNRTYYCELRGEVTGQLKNTGVPIVAVYEAAPNPIHAKLESQTLHYTT